MKTMNNYCAFTTRNILLAVLCFLLSGWVPLYAADDMGSEADLSPVFEVNAPIMSIDLDENLMVVAEEDIFLKYTVKDGKKQWQTDFLDAEGQIISVSVFKKRDRVLVNGSVTSSGKIVADKVTLLASGEEQKKSNSPQTVDSSSDQSSAPQVINGVWKN